MIRNLLKRTVFLTLLLALCLFSTTSFAASAVELNAEADAALQVFYEEVGSASELASMSKGMLILPAVYKGGFLLGAEFGEGVLRINNRTVDYYNSSGLSLGLLAGVQKKSVILLFMTEDGLAQFRASQNWEIGLDGSVAVVKLGVGKEFDSTNLKSPIIGFVFGNKGLMANISLEGSKLTRIEKTE
ncbi:MAG: hypothetical protein C0622_01175 [Desulfuromonas sp.]|nr:MAG: hypothetical protein C0622_01175 [Desulfuromonas sp.]